MAGHRSGRGKALGTPGASTMVAAKTRASTARSRRTRALLRAGGGASTGARNPARTRNGSSRSRTARKARGRIVLAEARPHTAGREEDGEEPRLEQHPVRLVGGEVLRRGDEGEEEDGADRARPARPDVEREQQGGGDSGPHQRRER